MATLTATQVRTRLDYLIDQVAASHQPVVISGKGANAVLLSEEDWNAIQETLHLLTISSVRSSIRDSMAEPLVKSKKVLKW